MTKQNTPATIHPGQWEVIDGMARPKNQFDPLDQAYDWDGRQNHIDEFETYPAPGLKDAVYDAEQLQFVWQIRTNKDLVEAGIDKEIIWRDMSENSAKYMIKEPNEEPQFRLAITATPTEVKEPEEKALEGKESKRSKIDQEQFNQQTIVVKGNKASFLNPYILHNKNNSDEKLWCDFEKYAFNNLFNTDVKDGIYTGNDFGDEIWQYSGCDGWKTIIKTTSKSFSEFKERVTSQDFSVRLFRPYIAKEKLPSMVIPPTTLLSEGKNDFTPNDIQLYDKFVTLESEGKETVEAIKEYIYHHDTSNEYEKLHQNQLIGLINGFYNQHTAKEIEALQVESKNRLEIIQNLSSVLRNTISARDGLQVEVEQLQAIVEELEYKLTSANVEIQQLNHRNY